MNVKEYIESGMLEGYALGLLSASEKEEVEQRAAEYPAIRKALKEHQETMGTLAGAYAVSPPADLKDKVMKAALGEEAKASEPKVRALHSGNSSSSGGNKPWAIAATILLLISGGLNFMQFQRTNNLEQDLTQTEIQLAQMATEQEVLAARYEEMEQDISVLRDPATTLFPMKGIEGRDPQFRADIYWNAQSEMVFLDVKNLPPAPSGKDYQLWALKDGKPIDMGIFKADFNAQDLLEVGQVPGADAFAVTLEPSGGSENPTLEEMYVYGEPVSV